MGTPHDSLFRDTFGKAEHAGPLLRALLPPVLAAAIDWDSLEPRPTPQVDEQQETQQTDALFAVRLGRRPALLHVVFEHTTRPDRWLSLRVLAYMVGIWKGLRRTRPAPRLLPPILPVVVSFGRRRWRAATDLQALLDLGSLTAAQRAALLPALPQFRFEPHDFVGRTPTEVRAMGLSLMGLWTVAAQQFLAPVGGDDDAAANAIAEWADVVRRLLLAPTGQAAFETLSSYILKTTRLGRERLVVLFEQHIGAGSMKKKFVSTWDRIKREGVVQGKAEGKLEGRIEGRIEGATTVLLQLLRRRFGELPDAVTARVAGGSQAELDRWVDRVLDAATLDDVFAR